MFCQYSSPLRCGLGTCASLFLPRPPFLGRLIGETSPLHSKSPRLGYQSVSDTWGLATVVRKVRVQATTDSAAKLVTNNCRA